MAGTQQVVDVDHRLLGETALSADGSTTRISRPNAFSVRTPSLVSLR